MAWLDVRIDRSTTAASKSFERPDERRVFWLTVGVVLASGYSWEMFSNKRGRSLPLMTGRRSPAARPPREPFVQGGHDERN